MKTEEFALRCSGMNCGSIGVPAFELSRGAMCGVSVPIGFGEDWALLMKVLSGELNESRIEVSRTGMAVCPQLGCSHFSDNEYIGESLKSLGLSETDYGAIDASERITSTTATGQLASTPRLLVELTYALKTSSDVIVFSTAGLDPAGIKAANQLIRKSGRTGVHLFATSLYSFYGQSEMFELLV